MSEENNTIPVGHGELPRDTILQVIKLIEFRIMLGERLRAAVEIEYHVPMQLAADVLRGLEENQQKIVKERGEPDTAHAEAIHLWLPCVYRRAEPQTGVHNHESGTAAASR